MCHILRQPILPPLWYVTIILLQLSIHLWRRGKKDTPTEVHNATNFHILFKSLSQIRKKTSLQPIKIPFNNTFHLIRSLHSTTPSNRPSKGTRKKKEKKETLDIFFVQRSILVHPIQRWWAEKVAERKYQRLACHPSSKLWRSVTETFVCRVFVSPNELGADAPFRSLGTSFLSLIGFSEFLKVSEINRFFHRCVEAIDSRGSSWMDVIVARRSTFAMRLLGGGNGV